jgi:hypothetical protein
MALSDRLKAPTKPMHGTPCSVGALLENLAGAELDALRTMLGTPDARGWSASAIYDALIAEGHSVGYQQINKHRGGKCRCIRQAAA